jgi:hypothetical protein
MPSSGKPLLSGQILVRITDRLEKDLREVAAAQRPTPVEPAEMLRWAAAAIVDCHKEHGSVPANMKIVQAAHPSQAEESAAPYLTELMAKTPVNLSADQFAAQLIEEISSHPLSRDRHVSFYFLAALRRALGKQLDRAAAESLVPTPKKRRDEKSA